MVSRLQQANLAEALLRRCWPSLATAANELLRPVHLHSAVAAVGLNMGDVCEIFAHLPGDTAIKKRPYLRTYVEGQMVPSLERKMWHFPLDKRTSFDDWFQQIFESAHSGFVLNGAERWAISASTKLARWLQPQLLNTDPLRLCLEIVLFAGDYGFTPFGVHRDEPCASVIHFNLGPHAKDIYIFEDDANLYGAPQIRDATRYRIEPGDGFVLPANYAHIGDAASFSVDISCKLMFRSNSAALAYVAEHLLDSKDDFDGEDLGELLLRRLGAGGHDEPVGETVDRWIDAARARARSNGHFIGTPIASNTTWDDHSTVSVNDSFPLVLHERGGHVTLFSRGRSVALTGHHNLNVLLDSLRGNRSMRVTDLLECTHSIESARSLVDFLVATRGISVST